MLATESDVMRTLRQGTYSLGDLYELCWLRADTARDNGHAPIPGHASDQVWKRRVRNTLQTMQEAGQAERIARARWAIEGPWRRPTRLLLIVAGGTLAEIELRLQGAIDLLRTLDEPADLVLADPPYGLGRGRDGHFSDGNGYRRDHSLVAPGYVDVDPAAYREFSAGWVSAAARALRPGGQIAVVTGPQRAAAVQVAAEDAGLTWVTSIAARREFAIATTRRPSPAHWTISVLCKGPLAHPRRVFHAPADLPAARSGLPYPLDWWPDNGRADRPRLYRYDNALPLKLVLRILLAFSDEGAHVVDPMSGSGTTAIGCYLARRRFTGGDLNPAAIRFAGARLLDEHAWPGEQAPALFPWLA
jgi:DNA modification methylase